MFKFMSRKLNDGNVKNDIAGSLTKKSKTSFVSYLVIFCMCIVPALFSNCTSKTEDKPVSQLWAHITADAIRGQLALAKGSEALYPLYSFADKTISRPMYDVDAYKVTYPVVFPAIGVQPAKTLTLSALVLVPRIGDVASAELATSKLHWGTDGFNNIGTGANGFPILLRMHGTMFANNEAPTVCQVDEATAQCQSNIGVLEASQGFIVIQPDYLGFGVTSNEVHPFIIPEYYQHDALAAVKAVITNESTMYQGAEIKKNTNGVGAQLYLTGYSEGGYAALATQQYFESVQANQNFKVVASAPGAAPFDLHGMAAAVFGRDFYAAPPFIANVYYAYQYVYGNDTSLDAKVWKEKYGSASYSAISSKNSRLEAISQVINSPTRWYVSPTPFPYVQGAQPAQIVAGVFGTTDPATVLSSSVKLARMTDILKPEFYSMWASAREVNAMVTLLINTFTIQNIQTAFAFDGPKLTFYGTEVLRLTGQINTTTMSYATLIIASLNAIANANAGSDDATKSSATVALANLYVKSLSEVGPSGTLTTLLGASNAVYQPLATSAAGFPGGAEGLKSFSTNLAKAVTDNFTNLFSGYTVNDLLLANRGQSVNSAQFVKLYEQMTKNSLNLPTTNGTTLRNTTLAAPTRLYNCAVDFVIPAPTTMLALTGKMLPRTPLTTYTAFGSKIHDANTVGDVNDPSGVLAPKTKGNSTFVPPSDPEFGKYSGHSSCPLVSAAVPWFVTYINK